MKEYVLDPEEFRSLSKGRVHWEIVKAPIYITRIDGTGRMDSGDFSVYLSVTAQAKEGNHVIAIKISCGNISRFTDNYQERLNQIREAAKADFPESTEGAWE